MPDGWEGYYGLNPNSADDKDWDSDSDGYDSDRDGELSPDEKFTNYEEFLADTNPSKADTDGIIVPMDGRYTGMSINPPMRPVPSILWMVLMAF